MMSLEDLIGQCLPDYELAILRKGCSIRCPLFSGPSIIQTLVIRHFDFIFRIYTSLGFSLIQEVNQSGLAEGIRMKEGVLSG